MRPAQHIEITTPRKVSLNGLWFGPRKAKRVIVFIHGLGGSVFSRLPIVDEIIDNKTAVITFNNRGHDKVTYAPRGKKSIRAGAAHEVFAECVDDIDGAVRFARAAGARDIFLAGHSTGCQKSAYWAAKKRLPAGRQGKGVRGIILLAPISDYSAEVKNRGFRLVAKGVALAKKMIAQGKPNHLMPDEFAPWPNLADAKRYLSLYAGEGVEEIFTYWDPFRVPKAVRSVRLPVLAVLAERDEHADRPAKRMADWFAEHLKVGDQVVIVPKVEHSFKGGEKTVARHMHKFMKEAVQ